MLGGICSGPYAPAHMSFSIRLGYVPVAVAIQDAGYVVIPLVLERVSMAHDQSVDISRVFDAFGNKRSASPEGSISRPYAHTGLAPGDCQVVVLAKVY